MGNPYGGYSYWLEDAGEPPVERPPLRHSIDVDVAILGAGYSGLWTAYYLLQAQPSLKVAIVEKHCIGFGGSGRNGGWCSPRFPVSAGLLEKRYGADKARSLLLAVEASARAIGRVCEEESIDAQFHPAGTLILARSENQLRSIQSSYASYERLGLADRYRLLSSAEANERIRVTNVDGALFTPDGASLHPARLVRGLARAVEARGGTIYEDTAVVDYKGGADARLVTAGGEVRAKKALVLAGESYLTQFPSLHRAYLPVYSLICLTEPLSEQQWKRIGWAQGENVASARNSVVYLTRTADGRILFGSRGAPYAFASRIADAQDRHAETITFIQQSLLAWFPSLAGIAFTHAWGGPVAMPSDWMPSVHFDKDSRQATIGGFTGQGVSTSHMAGQLLAGMIGEHATGLEELSMAQHRSPRWILEPLRWLVVRYMQDALLRIDEATEAGRKKPIDAVVAEFLGRH